MSREPTLADWFEIVCNNREKARTAVNATGMFSQYAELYEDIVGDADRQLRALSNRFRKLATYAEFAAEKAKKEAEKITDHQTPNTEHQDPTDGTI